MMKRGSLVKMIYADGSCHPRDGIVGIVTEVHELDRHVKVLWPNSYGAFWTTRQALEVLSEAR